MDAGRLVAGVRNIRNGDWDFLPGDPCYVDLRRHEVFGGAATPGMMINAHIVDVMAFDVVRCELVAAPRIDLVVCDECERLTTTKSSVQPVLTVEMRLCKTCYRNWMIEFSGMFPQEEEQRAISVLRARVNGAGRNALTVQAAIAKEQEDRLIPMRTTMSALDRFMGGEMREKQEPILKRLDRSFQRWFERSVLDPCSEWIARKLPDRVRDKVYDHYYD